MPRRLSVMIGLLMAILIASAGCYRRVVDAEGFGARTRPVHEENMREPPDKKTGILEQGERR